MSRQPRILIADDNADILEALRLLLKGAGFGVVRASSPTGVEASIAAELGQPAGLDVALIDMNYARDTTSGGEGLDLITKIRALDPTLPIIVMTAWGSVAGAVEAMKRGARDYIEKPWQNDRLLATIRIQIELREAMRETSLLREQTH